MGDSKVQTETTPIPDAGVRSLWRAGRQAIKTVPGTRRLLFQGFLLTHVISLLLAVVLAFAVYHFLMAPALVQVEQWGAGQGAVKETLALVSKGLLWVGLVIVVLASQVVALLLTLSMMSLWFEAVVDRIVRYRQGHEGPSARPRSLLDWLKATGASLFDSIGLVILSLLALLVGLVPIVGSLIAFFLNSYLMGREIRDPYVAVRAVRGDRPRALVKGRLGWTIRTGVWPVLVAMIPVAGWLLVPTAVVYLAAGLAWIGEGTGERAGPVSPGEASRGAGAPA